VVDDDLLLMGLHDAAAAACIRFLLRALSNSTYLCDVRISDNGCDMRCPRLSSVIFPLAAGAESLLFVGQYCSGTRVIATGGDGGSGCAVGKPGWRVVIAQVLATLRANVRSCDVRYLKTQWGSGCGVAKDGFDGGATVIASEIGCDGCDTDDAICGVSVGGGGDYELRDASDARRSCVLVREGRGHEDLCPSRRRAHGRWIDRVEEVGCDYSVEEREMCRRVGRMVEDERLQQRQRLKCQCQAASLYRDAGDGEALWMVRATCCDCASDTDDASQHLRLLEWPPTRAISLIPPSRKSSQCFELPCRLPWVEGWSGVKVQVRLSGWLMTNGLHAIPRHTQYYLYSRAKALRASTTRLQSSTRQMRSKQFTSFGPPRPNNVPCLAVSKERTWSVRAPRL